MAILVLNGCLEGRSAWGSTWSSLAGGRRSGSRYDPSRLQRGRCSDPASLNPAPRGDRYPSVQPGDLKPPFDTLAILLPLLGPVAALVIAALLRGSPRRLAFAVGPFLVGLAMCWVRPGIATRPGDWLAELGVSALYGIGYLGIGVYYVVLLVVAIGCWLRRNAELRRAAMDPGPSGSSPAGPG